MSTVWNFKLRTRLAKEELLKVIGCDVVDEVDARNGI